MKKLILLTVAAAALAFATGRAAASPSPFTLSGYAEFNWTNYMKGSNYIAKTVKMTFGNTFLYNWLSNAVANATNGLATNFPAKGYIGYSPFYYDGKHYGAFYVADGSGFHYWLSGLDTNGMHYDFGELNSYDWFFGNLGRGDCCCCCGGFPSNSVYMANYSLNNGFGSYSAIDRAQLIFRTDPYRNPSNDVDVDTLTLFGTLNQKLNLKYFYPYPKSGADFIGSGSIGITWGNVTEGFTYYKGIVPSATFKIDY